MLVDYFDRNFQRGCIPYTSIDGLIEEMDGHGTIATSKGNVKTSMRYDLLREAYKKAIDEDMEMMSIIGIDEEDDEGV